MSVEVVFATVDAAVALPGGGQVRLRRGEHWVATDPVVTQYPHLFSDDPRYGARYTSRPAVWDADGGSEPPVEVATAAPGERRNTVRQARRG